MPGPPPIPVIDLFAGPGGLGEGFSSLKRAKNCPGFEIRLSIEKDFHAHQTLRLRSFFRKFPFKRVPHAYYDCLRNIDDPLDLRLSNLFGQFPTEAQEADKEAWLSELGGTDPRLVHDRIEEALADAPDWVLLGGPPCQAYSLVGRSRNRGNPGYKEEEDERQHLYLEYLRVIADHSPTIFIMENVKGLLSATLGNKSIFERILTDLEHPAKAIRREDGRFRRPSTLRPKPNYRIIPLVDSGNGRLYGEDDSRDFIIKMEKHGIPQARHRLILLGIREDLGQINPVALPTESPISVCRVLDDLPRLRSGLSKEPDSKDQWLSCIRDAERLGWFRGNGSLSETQIMLAHAMEKLRRPLKNRGSEFVQHSLIVEYKPDWFHDPRLEGVCNHTTRGHLRDDLYRYFFAACFAQVKGQSPTLPDFPKDLWPKHKNVASALNGSNFADRFRVQTRDRPSTTITSHIAKDGHYYIHHDPTQCRSLTVREAARIQTFPDNYFFCGPRTEQYRQVGNAVPPLLAIQIAEVVSQILAETGVVLA